MITFILPYFTTMFYCSLFQVPINSDQLVNVKEAVKANIGLSVPWTELTEQKFDLAVNEVSRWTYISIS